MRQIGGSYEPQYRPRRYGGGPGSAGVRDQRSPQRTAAGAALLSAFPAAFVIAATYPVVGAAVLTLAVGLLFVSDGSSPRAPARTALGGAQR